MTPHRFNMLEQSMQQKLLLRKSVFLTERHVEDFSVLLFQLGPFYVETYFQKENDEIVSIKCVERTDELAPYQDKINYNVPVPQA